jgi:putative transposase
VLKVLGLSKKTWYYAQQRRSYEERYYHLRKPLLETARDHPEYGYRRTAVELQEMGYPINRKVVAKLHNYWGLSLMRTAKRPKKSAVRALLQEAGSLINLVASLEEIDDFEVLYTDFTQIRYQRGHAKAQWIPIIDHKSKLVMGHALGESPNTDLALDAWSMICSSFRQLNLKIEGVIVHSDQDGVFTGHRWLRETVLRDRVRVSYSEDGAKGNVYMESFFGRFKEENRSILWEQEDLHSLWEVVKSRVRYYNQERRHSALGYKSPIKYLNEKGKIPSRDASEK